MKQKHLHKHLPENEKQPKSVRFLIPLAPVTRWVFINTSSASRVEYWINRELYSWGHWIDAIGNTIVYRQHDYLNPVAQTYQIENTRLRIDKSSSAIVWGTFRRFERPEWWILEEH
jgi:hypothetical protein